MKSAAIEAEHIKKLEWAISLSQVDLKKLREGDRLNLIDELCDFLIPGWLNLSESEKKKHRKEQAELVTGKLGQIQFQLKKYLDSIICSDARPGTLSHLFFGQSFIQVPLESAFIVVSARPPGSPFQLSLGTMKSDPEKRVYLGFVSHLISSRITPEQIRSCPECGRPFLLKRKPRADKQFHCLPKCARLAATRRYRQKKATDLKLKEKERSHHRYVERQKRKWSGVKVGRKARRAKS